MGIRGATLMVRIATRGQRRVGTITTRRTDRIAIIRIMDRRIATMIRTMSTTISTAIISRRLLLAMATTAAVRR